MYVCTLTSELPILGLNLDRAINCQSCVSQVEQFINVRAVLRMDVKLRQDSFASTNCWALKIVRLGEKIIQHSNSKLLSKLSPNHTWKAWRVC